MTRALLLALLLSFAPAAARAQAAAPRPIDIPAWFTESFFDLREDVREAAKGGKRLMLYFGQDGCPYCRALMETNFEQSNIVTKMRAHFVAEALNVWGDREVTGFDGQTMSEKEFARAMRVQFTPTLLFFDEKGSIVARLNGYYPPHRFEAALDYVAGKMEGKQAFADYMRSAAREAASATLHEEPFFTRPPHDLRRGAKPLAVLFETPYCSGCDELHREGFRRPEVRAQLAKFDVARFALGDDIKVVTPSGKKTRAADWARELGIAYTPSIVFFDRGREVFRIEAYLRPFHLAGSFDYVASGAYATEPSFQRFLQARAERLRNRGDAVDLWK
ncbi:MAG TPA: thioredoxin fold domain-containing protein [Burkholderiales bacterium]|nr:thioredoxin fold domain-containing protein [Burkholderiales bacterium]